MSYTSLGADGAHPNLSRWEFMRDVEKTADALTDPGYKALHDYYMPMTTALVNGILAKDKLDAIIYPTSATRPPQIVQPAGAPLISGPYAEGVANLAGFPDLIVPAGFTTDNLPVTVSFLGTAFSEPKLLALGYAYEQATHNIRRPVNTPALPGDTITVPDKVGPAQ
jgi:amidase